MSIPQHVTRTALLLALTPVAFAQSTECLELTPTGGAAGDRLGTSVATDGLLAAVGAPRADAQGADSGAAYLFDAANGSQQHVLLPTGGAAGDQFGAAIAIDGTRVVVGAPLADPAGASSGTAYVFDAATGAQLLELSPSNAAAGDRFGVSVAADGGLVVVGALGSAYVFDATTGLELHELTPSGGSGAGFGEAVDIDDGKVVVGARAEDGVSGFSGAAYLFDAASGDQLHRMVATNGTVWAFFGASVAIDGDVVAIGAPEAGPQGKHSGAAYVFDASSGQQEHYLFPADGHVFAKFGSAVAVDGQDVFFGSEQNNPNALFSTGSVYVYDAQSGAQLDKWTASNGEPNDDLGGAVAAAAGVVVAGAASADPLGDDSGAAYVFDVDGCPCGSGASVYCTSKPSSIPGCVPALSFSGSPSASAGSGFVITAGPTPGNNAGLFLYTTAGAAAAPADTPFGSLCLSSPFLRFGAQIGGGTTGTCSGAYTVDFNAFVSTQTTDPSLVAGAGVDVQAWYRDPANPGLANLTEAGHFTLCP